MVGETSSENDFVQLAKSLLSKVCIFLFIITIMTTTTTKLHPASDLNIYYLLGP